MLELAYKLFDVCFSPHIKQLMYHDTSCRPLQVHDSGMLWGQGMLALYQVLGCDTTGAYDLMPNVTQ